MHRRLLALTVLLLLPAFAGAADTVTVTGGPKDATHVVCAVPAPASLASAKAGTSVLLTLPSGGVLLGQVGPPGLGSGVEGLVLTFVVPMLEANGKSTYSVEELPMVVGSGRGQFRFAETAGEHTDTLYGDKPVVRFVHKKRDKDDHELTFKPFHHVFDPADGKATLTNGPGHAADKAQKFPHHRGLFFGWKARYNGKVADTWHGHKGVYTEVERVTASDAGPVYGRQRALINWVGEDGLQFAEEERELTAYAAPGGTLLDFTARVTTKLPKVTLDGDPQHAGFHFRAAMDVATTTAKETVYTRPDGQDKPGATRNWTDKTPGHKDLAWDAMSFTTGGKRYTAVTLDRPDNPKEARFSERDYGRFGSYFVADVTPKTPVIVKYRVFVKAGDTTVAECERLSQGFIGAVAVK